MKRNVDASPSLDSYQMVPPWRSTICFPIASPISVPVNALPRKVGPKSRFLAAVRGLQKLLLLGSFPHEPTSQAGQRSCRQIVGHSRKHRLDRACFKEWSHTGARDLPAPCASIQCEFHCFRMVYLNARFSFHDFLWTVRFSAYRRRKLGSVPKDRGHVDKSRELPTMGIT